MKSSILQFELYTDYSFKKRGMLLGMGTRFCVTYWQTLYARDSRYLVKTFHSSFDFRPT